MPLLSALIYSINLTDLEKIMAKFDGILICTDLDGTLLKKDKTVSRENLDAIEYFKANGGYFTYVTGRMPFFSYESSLQLT